MIRPLTDPIEAKYQGPCARTPGRYEGLVNFAQKLRALFLPALPRWTVLDVGGADGWLGEMLICRRYWWVDPQAVTASMRVYRNQLIPTDLTLKRFTLERLTTATIGRAEALPWATGSVDLVVSKQTLPHFEQPILACREMLRVARHAVVIRQEFPSPDTSAFIAANPHARNYPEPQVPGYGPIGWAGHSRSQIDHPSDILEAFTAPGVHAYYDGEDFVVRRGDP